MKCTALRRRWPSNCSQTPSTGRPGSGGVAVHFISLVTFLYFSNHSIDIGSAQEIGKIQNPRTKATLKKSKQKKKFSPKKLFLKKSHRSARKYNRSSLFAQKSPRQSTQVSHQSGIRLTSRGTQRNCFEN